MKKKWGTGRTEAFSDAVFAIAITLLVLDLAVPDSQLNHFWRAIGRQWPSLLGYATSFLTIGSIWLGHHSIFERLRYANNTVMRVNLVLLMAVAFLPFPTRLMAEAIRNSHAERGAVVLYGISAFVTMALISALWLAIVRGGELLKPEVSDKEIAAVTRAVTPSVALLLGAIVLAIIVPRAAAFGYLVIAVVAALRAGGMAHEYV